MNRPMKWHKFLIYYSLWLGAVCAFLRGAKFFAVVLFGDTNPQIPEPPAMKALDIAYGVIYLALAAYHIYTRYQLARFKKGAPKHLLILYAIIPVFELAYLPLVLIAADIPVSALFIEPAKYIGTILGTIIAAWILCALNKIYYDKRKELFIN